MKVQSPDLVQAEVVFNLNVLRDVPTVFKRCSDAVNEESTHILYPVDFQTYSPALLM